MIESVQNKNVKQWKKLNQKKYRDQTGLFWIEGWHLVEEAIKSDFQIDVLVVSERVELPDIYRHLPVEIVTEQVMRSLAQTESTQGIGAVIKQKQWVFETSQRALLFDRLQDPGNVGTLIRTAKAFGVDTIVFGKGTVDLYNPKVLRSTQGAAFHLPIFQGDLNTWIKSLKEKDVAVYGTALSQRAKPLPVLKSQGPYAILLGNEGAGVDPDLLELCDEQVYIPHDSAVESLNVAIAGSIILYHFSMNQ